MIALRIPMKSQYKHNMMFLFIRRNQVLLLLSLVLIAFGFVVMKLDPAQYGYGMWALTIAPVTVILGYILGFASIFNGQRCYKSFAKQRTFLLVGWIVFLIALAVYHQTMEETASLWDCAEFIACAYKLQIPHAPGAPLFLMVGRLFSLAALGDTSKVALWVNMTSVVSSAAAVMFVFWSIVMLGRKINKNASNFSLVLSGLVGALSIAFADSFWFSAVEAETYAMATLFLMASFWAVLKWEQEDGGIKESRWLIFICYILGLSVGVHPLSLLILPAILIVFVFKNHGFSWKNLILAMVAGSAILFFLNHVVLFGLPDLMKYGDIFCVNVLHMPFFSGAIIVMLALVIVGYLGYTWSINKHRKVISLALVSLMYFLIGYSSYFMIIIRSQANPSIDEHNPENLITLASYLKRESYGSRPFLYGPDFAAGVHSYKRGAAVYSKMKDKYEISDFKLEYVYHPKDQTIFPRMYSNEPAHIETYRKWTGLKVGEKPKFMDHLRYMLSYQFGHMYFRYFMFNFAGRASDVQHAEWLSPLDALEKHPKSIRANKSRNNFLMLPLLLGMAGIIFQYRKDQGGFWAVMTFFLFFGLILVFYLNSTPNEPRERDYIYVGSYVAFSIWIGLGAIVYPSRDRCKNH